MLSAIHRFIGQAPQGRIPFGGGQTFRYVFCRPVAEDVQKYENFYIYDFFTCGSREDVWFIT